jgi:hypothetical protein
VRCANLRCPVGPPDPAAREVIWDRYLTAIPHDELDMAAIATPPSHMACRPLSRGNSC